MISIQNPFGKSTGAPAAEEGFSLIEALIVLAIVIIMMAVAIFALGSHKRAYRSEDAAAQVVNYMRESYQRALTQRQTMRLVIDQKNSKIKIIDQGRLPDGDEGQIREALMIDSSEVIMSRPAVGGTDIALPPAPYNFTPAVFNQGVWEAQFRSDGSVVDGSNTPAPLSATFYFWPYNPASSTTPKDVREIRAVTIFGPSGSIRYWKYDGEKFIKEVN